MVAKHERELLYNFDLRLDFQGMSYDEFENWKRSDESKRRFVEGMNKVLKWAGVPAVTAEEISIESGY
jgi:hypothetical protein